MDFCWVTLRVRDLEASLAFYQGVLGLPVRRRFGLPGGTEIAFLGDGDKPQIELLCDPKSPPAGSGEGVSVGVTVNSLEEATELLQKNKIPLKGGPFAPNPRVRFFYAADPDGYTVQLVEQH